MERVGHGVGIPADEHRAVFVVALTACVVTARGFVQAQSSREAEAALKAAQHQEEVLGDLAGAIEAYKKLAESGDRAVAAQALLRLAGCYQKLGNDEAAKIYQRVVTSGG